MADSPAEDRKQESDGNSDPISETSGSLNHGFVETEGNIATKVKSEKQDFSEETNQDTEKHINSEDAVRLKQFLESSLHMVGEFPGQSSNYYKGESSKTVNDSYSDSTESSVSGDENVQCEICQKIFLEKLDLEDHIRSRRMDDKRYMCCNCQKVFRDNTQLKVHARKHTGEKPFECNICHKKFTVNGNLNKHLRIHTGEKRFECTDCGKKFTQFAHLEDHLKTHSGERPFVCTYCQSAFKTKARLRKHEKSHLNVGATKRVVGCPKCDIVLKSNRQLATHLATHVQDSDGPFICHLCGKAFAKYTNLQEHQLSHSEMKTFFCEFCDKKFSNASHLRRHMNSHSGFRPYSCHICNRPFPSSQNLKRHMMTHTGERPYDCTECGRKFLTLENLNRHKRTHTGEKPFACEVCGRVFAHSTTAKEHYRTVHTGEKPYGCSLCEQRFAVSKMLYKHIRIKHPEHFPQFKKEQNMTPNMRKAMARFKKGIKCEDGDVKYEFESEEACEEAINRDQGENPKTKPKIKIEPIEEEPSSPSIKNTDGLVSIKIEKECPDGITDGSTVKNEPVDIPFIKTEIMDIEDC